MSVIYLIGSLRNPEIPKIAAKIREAGFEVFDDWWSASEDADDWLRDYYRARNFSYQDMLNSHAAKHIFSFDKFHLDRADVGLLVMPAGKSGHLELGYMAGQGKRCFVLFNEVPERVDIMYQFANGGVYFDIDSLIGGLNEKNLYSRPNEESPSV
jgi:hypothetical protein